MNREKFSSRLGFVLISAGCAIGLGNVYRFPILTGSYGGAFFVLIYFCFLLLLGIPVMMAELSVGRASQRSIATSFDVLEKPGQKWHLMKILGIGGNYLLMMCYTTISSWMLIYFFKYLSGSILTADTAQAAGDVFGAMTLNTPLVAAATVAVIVIGLAVCSLGLQKGVEKITKYMMLALFALMVCLAIYCCTLDKAADGLRFYLIPSLQNLREAGVWTVISAAMGQAFFSLSLGMGSIAVFGSYIDRSRRLTGEAVTIVSLDTFVALMSGLIVFPACFTYNGGVTADAGTVSAGFLFTTLSAIFNAMPAGRIIGTAFFLFMLFAAMSTVIAVFENIISFWLDMTKLKRRTVALINIVLITALSLPSVMSLGPWSNFKIFGLTIMDLEDKLVSSWILPIGSLIYVIFCTRRYGWGWKNFLTEVNTGSKGPVLPGWLRGYFTWVLPVIILAVLAMSVL